MRIIIFSFTFFLLLIASITNAQNQTSLVTSTIAPSSTVLSTYTLTGTVGANISLDILTNEMTLTNISTTSTPTIAVVLTNPLPSGGGYTLLTPGWECETSGDHKPKYICSTQVGSLSVGDSISLRLDHELQLPTYECEEGSEVSGTQLANRQLDQPSEKDGAHRACYVEILSPQAVVSLSNSRHFELSLLEPLYNSVCSCGVMVYPPSWDIYLPLFSK
ncbi:MAG: hypothetical protein AAF702_31515 [Chloroflexota bacterium]